MKHLTFIWALLIGATLISFASTYGKEPGPSSIDARAILIFTIALVKARFVILYMMDVRSAPVALRVIMEVWVFGMWIILSVLSTAPIHNLGRLMGEMP